MSCRISDLRDKQVICMCDGTVLGLVCDVEVDTCTGCLNAIVIYGRSRCFGIFGREDDIIIPWCEIKVIGCDTVLVSCSPPIIGKKRGLFGRGVMFSGH